MSLFVRFDSDVSELWLGDDEADLRVAYSGEYHVGWARLEVSGRRPSVPEGKRLVRHFRKSDDGAVCYKEYLLFGVDEALPEPVSSKRRWSRLSIKRALSAEGKWEQARDLMKQADAYDEFLMCDYIEEGDEMYNQMYPALAALVGEQRLSGLLDSLPTV